MENTGTKRRVRPAAIIAAVLVLALAIGGTLAYLARRSASAANTFTLASTGLTTSVENDALYLTNTSNTPVFVRGKVVVTWQDGDGNISATAPVSGTDYSLTRESAWTEHSGAFYYNGTVAVNAKVKLGQCSRLAGANPPEGYTYLNVVLLGESVQSEGSTASDDTAVHDAWGASWDGSAWSFGS